MREFKGKVAVVTGGASGIGRALGEAFLAEGMTVVLADVEKPALEKTVEELGVEGAPVTGVVTDVSSHESVEFLAEQVFSKHGTCHILCNNAGVGAPSVNVWETTVNDWKWVHGVNVMGVVHGILAFVPRMLAAGEEGHIINTSSGDGGVSPLPDQSVYASSKAAVSTLTECLAAQLQATDSKLRASIFYPAGGLLKTGIWTCNRNRPLELARERPFEGEPQTIEKFQVLAKKAGFDLPIQPLDELAQGLLDGLREERFIITLGLDRVGTTLRERAARIEKAELPIEPSRGLML